MALRYLVPVTLVIALTGCGSIGAMSVPWKRDRAVASQPAPLPPPTTMAPVQSADLAPLGPPGSATATGAYPPPADGSVMSYPTDGGTGGGLYTDPLAPPAGTQTAMTAPSTPGAALGRTDLLGGWTITSTGDSCQLFMTLTSWTGGYRASTRGCSTELLKSISAWNLEGAQVVLAGQGGTPVARLSSAGSNRFDGQANGQMVSFYR